MVAKRLSRRKKEGTGISAVFFSLLFLALAVGVLGVLLVQNVRMAQKRVELGTVMENLEQRMGNLEQRKQDLEAGLEQSQGAEYQEEVLRERGLYKRSGETAVTVVAPEEEEGTEEEEGRVWWNPFTW